MISARVALKHPELGVIEVVASAEHVSDYGVEDLSVTYNGMDVEYDLDDYQLSTCVSALRKMSGGYEHDEE